MPEITDMRQRWCMATVLMTSDLVATCGKPPGHVDKGDRAHHGPFTGVTWVDSEDGALCGTDLPDATGLCELPLPCPFHTPTTIQLPAMVWMSTRRRGLDYHHMRDRWHTGCGRHTRTFVLLPRDEAVREVGATPCAGCYRDGAGDVS